LGLLLSSVLCRTFRSDVTRFADSARRGRPIIGGWLGALQSLPHRHWIEPPFPNGCSKFAVHNIRAVASAEVRWNPLTGKDAARRRACETFRLFISRYNVFFSFLWMVSLPDSPFLPPCSSAALSEEHEPLIVQLRAHHSGCESLAIDIACRRRSRRDRKRYSSG